MRSKYSDRLYDYLKPCEGRKIWFVEISRLKKILKCEQYNNGQFTARVLDPAMHEINEKSDIIIDYSYLKNVKTIVGVEFHIDAKETKEIKMNNENKIMPAPSVIEQAICDKLSQLNKDIKFYEEPLKKLKEQKAELLKWCKDNGMTMLGEQ